MPLPLKSRKIMKRSAKLSAADECPARISKLSVEDDAQLPSYMLRLPAEIRLQIFEYAYGHFVLRPTIEIASADPDRVVVPVGESKASEKMRPGYTRPTAMRRRPSTKKLPPELSRNAHLGIPLTCKLFAHAQ